MRRIKLYHHPECAKCHRIARFHGWFNWFGTLTVSTDVPPTGPLAMGAIAATDTRTGQTVLGVEASRWVFQAIPGYWPWLPLLYIPFIARKVDRETRGCSDGGCGVPAVLEAREKDKVRT